METTTLTEKIRNAMQRSGVRNATEYVQTWEQGQDLPSPHDLRRFAEEGYSKNSLIYSCIRMKATSFASLDGQVMRPDESGTPTVPAPGHRIVQLLDSPNGEQDGEEFAEALETQFESAGNVFIKKGRQTSRERMQQFSTFPVKELRLIRPDYVSIRPGRSPAEDRFVVKVGGHIREELPRSEVIHIAKPNLINDFYGLSPIALIVRESSVDLEMSDYELAFYRNAGVPLGILKVKGTMTAAQKEETKSAFRRALNGFRGWFDVLITNADVMEYQQLGVKPAELESDATRFHVESRICSVFGVPPGLVGARFAIANGAQARSPEDEQFAFWSEEMVPTSRRIASAYTRGLLPEFATGADRGAVFTYDYTKVRALQEDLSRKLREVTRLINTGAVMVSEAFRRVGLTPPANSDFYLRSGNQAQVTVNDDGSLNVQTVPQPAGGAVAEPSNPLEGSA